MRCMESTIEEIAKANKPIILFGAGNIGKEAGLYFIENHPEIRIEKYFDNSFFLWGKRIIDDIYCERPQGKVEEYVCLITTGEKHIKEIEIQAKKMGFFNVYIWSDTTDYNSEVHDLRRKYIDLLNKRTPKYNLYYVVDIVEHCNLNCQMCDHFAPISDEHFMTLEAYIRDAERIAEIYGDNGSIPFVCIEGGEPLLHPNINSIIENTRRILSKTQIQIFTTGLLLSKMGEDFWKICRICEVMLVVTKYPIKFDYEVIVELAAQNKVSLKFFSGDLTVKTSYHKPIDLKGTQNKYESFHRCYMANGECADLKGGKLYPCTFAANIHIFNQYFKQRLQITEKDYIDIYSTVTPEDIGEFLSNPIPACKYCDVKNWTYNHVWGISKKTINEWV